MINFPSHEKHNIQHHRNKHNHTLPRSGSGFSLVKRGRSNELCAFFFFFSQFKDISTSLTQFFIFYCLVSTSEKFQALKDSNDFSQNQSWALSPLRADLHEISESFSASINHGCRCLSGPRPPLRANSPKQFS